MRARNLKPKIFKNELLAVADPIYTLIFEGLWCLADRDGRLEDRPALIHFEINPGRIFDGTERSLGWLAMNGFIERYRVGDCAYIQVIKFAKHQSPHHKEPASIIPKPGVSPGLSTQPVEPNASVKPRAKRHAKSVLEHKAALTPDSGLLTPDSGLLTPNSEELELEQLEFGNSSEVSSNGGGAKTKIPLEAVRRIFDHWRIIHGHPHAQLDDKRRKLIGGALELYSEANLCQCISGYANSPHHMGENDRDTVYDDIGVMLRDAKHIDAGLKFYADPPQTERSKLMRRNIAATAGWQPPELRNAPK